MIDEFNFYLQQNLRILFLTLFPIIFTEIGTFPWPWEKKGKPSALDEYGLGLVFYFKLVRSLAIIFALISAITVPSMAIFISAKVLNTSDQYYEVVTQSERLLGSKVSTVVRYVI